MTRLPAENRDVKGLSGDSYPKYKVGPLCCVPGCSRLADHAHHIWRRSFLAGDYSWVQLWDGTTVGNLAGLCWRHHNDVTENRSLIEWEGSAFTWQDEEQQGSFLLDPQPPAWVAAGDRPKRRPKAEHEHEGPGSVEKCPACNRTLPREKTGDEPKRPRKTWAISVPVDERENGADVLDTLLLACSELFGHDETKATRYFTLAQALALVLQNAERMLGDE